MSYAELFILAVGLSMDAFAVSICKGLSIGRVKMRHILACGVWFGAFQAMMPVAGYFLGRTISDTVSRWSHIIACALLVVIGVDMLWEARKDEEETSSSMDFLTMLMMAVATSIDALAAGASFALLKINIAAAAALIGITTFVISSAGVRIGSIFGTRFRVGAQIAGGIILILLGIRVLLI